MRSSLAKTAVCILLLTATLGPALPATGAPGDFLVACGTVVNAVGWAVPGVHVKAVGNGLASVRDNPLPTQEDTMSTVTDANGFFSLTLRRDDHVFVLNDTLDPTHPSRAGAAYAPTTVSKDLLLAPSLPYSCPGGVAGVNRHDMGKFVLAAPGQGFVLATAKDGAHKDQPALAGVDVSLTATFTGPPTVDPSDQSPDLTPDLAWFHAHTDATGAARLACQGPTSGGTPYALLFRSGGHLDAQRALSCSEGGLAAVDVLLWRRPLGLAVHVTNATDATEMAWQAGALPAASGVEMPVAGAALALVRSPADLGAFTPASALCKDAQPDHPVSLTNASPYLCAAATDPSGVGRLALPWSDADGYAIRASAGGYEPATTEQAVTEWDAVGFGVGAPRLVDLRLALPGGLVLAHAVLDANGTGVAGATISFDDGTTQVERATGEGGAFTVPLSAGPHNVVIQADGYNVRACQVRIVNDSGAAKLDGVNPSHCFRLLRAGNAVVGGVVQDADKTVRIPGVQVCTGATCTTTNAQGEYFLEVPAGATFSVQTHDSARWKFSTPRAGTAPASPDQITPIATTGLARKTGDVTIRVAEVDANGEPGPGIANADVVIKRGATQMNTPPMANPAFNKTGADGRNLVALAWSKHATLAGTAHEPYTVFVTRHNGDVHFTQTASVAFDLLDAELTKEVVVLMSPEGNVSIAVTATDAHTGEPVNARVTVTPATMQPGLVCGRPHECASDTPGSVFVHPGHIYKWCVTATGYAVECQDRFVSGDAPFSKVLRRNATQLVLTLLDAHTQRPVSGVQVSAATKTAGFTCAPTAAYTCVAKTSDAAGQATLTLPWTSPRQICFSIPPTLGAVILPNTEANATLQEPVGFQAATSCWESTWENKLTQANLTPLREAAPAVTGVVQNASGGPVPTGARVSPATDREGFVCDPERHNSTGSSFGHCDGVPVGAEGGFSLTLPNGGRPEHLWSLTARAEGFFDETYTHVGNMSGRAQAAVPYGPLPHPFVLWTKSFPVTVRVLDDATGSPCVLEEGETLAVVLTDVESGGQYDALAEDAGEGCEAEVLVQEWSRGSRPLPAFVGPWPKDASSFVVDLVSPYRVGTAFARLGPATTTVEVRSVKPSGDASVAPPIVVAGILRDANASTVHGVAGAHLVATRVGGACPGGTDVFHGFSRPDGNYTVAVGCGGEYDVSITHSALYAPFTPVRLSLLADPLAPADVAERGLPTLERNFTLERAAATLRLTAYELDTDVPRPIQGVAYRVAGVDTTTTAGPLQTGADGVAAFHGLAWGVYLVEVSGPTGFVHAASKVPVLVMPGLPNAYSTFAFRP